MSNPIICHISPAGGIDDRIAQFLDNGMTKEDIGTLRGLYDMDNNDPLISPIMDDKDIQGLELAKVANKLMEYKSSQATRHLNEMNNSTHHMARTFNQLYKVPGWNEATRRNRINMVVSEFTAEVSRRVAAAVKAGTPKTREQVINGYKVNGQSAGWWWVRSPGYFQYYAAFVNNGGSFRSHSVRSDSGCVRPAFWINLESDFF